MDLNSLPVFRAVVESGSFAGAARALGLPKSTVSHKVAALEHDLGVSLITRTTRRLRLTEAGERYFNAIVRSLGELQLAGSEAVEEQAKPGGLLRITAPAELGKVIARPLIDRFIREHPQVNVELAFTDRIVDLVRENFDLAFRAGQLEDSNLKAKRLGISEFQCFASPAYLRRQGVPAKPQDLALEHDALVFTTLTPDGVWELRQGEREANIAVRARIRANDLVALRELATAGYGIALLPDYFAEPEVRSGRLVRVLPQWFAERAPLHLVYPPLRYMPPKVRAFIDHVAKAPDFLKRARLTKS